MTLRAHRYETISNSSASPERLELQASGERLEVYLEVLDANANDVVLDVGCGAGALTRAVDRHSGATVVGFDTDARKVAYCRRAAAKAGLDRLRYVDGEVATFAANWEGRFSLVTCRYVLMYALPDEACVTLLAAMARCLAPGGRLVVFEADINFAHRFFPPLPTFAVSAFEAVIKFYRDQDLIEWRRGISLGHLFDLAGFFGAVVEVIDGRVIRNGEPFALVVHDRLDVEDLIGPALAAVGRGDEVQAVATCYCDALGRMDGLCYTPIFAATWIKPR